jgi:hypothetical protein
MENIGNSSLKSFLFKRLCSKTPKCGFGAHKNKNKTAHSHRKVMFMGGVKGFILKSIVPTDEETLLTWLCTIELFNILLSPFLVLLLALMMYTDDVAWTIKLGVLLLIFVIGISTLNLIQYQLQIEFNTRGDKPKKRG